MGEPDGDTAEARRSGGPLVLDATMPSARRSKLSSLGTPSHDKTPAGPFARIIGPRRSRRQGAPSSRRFRVIIAISSWSAVAGFTSSVLAPNRLVVEIPTRRQDPDAWNFQSRNGDPFRIYSSTIADRTIEAETEIEPAAPEIVAPLEASGIYFSTISDRTIEAETEIEAAVPEIVAPLEASLPTLAIPPNKWTLRLDTHMDKLNAHKWSTMLYCVSTAVIAATGLSSHLEEVPAFLCVWTWLYLYSSHVMGVTSIVMALKYRKDDQVSRTGFINTALISMAFTWATMYMSPFAPDAFDSIWFGNGMAALTNAPAIVIGLQQASSLPTVFESKQFKSNRDLATKAAIGTVVVVGLYNSARAGHILLDLSHDRPWVIEATENLELPNGKLFMTYNYYANVFGSMAASYGSLGITLYHKRLISSLTQQLMVGGLALPYFMFQLYAWGDFW